MAQQTRLGLYGGPRGLYGSFSGKAEASSVAFKSGVRVAAAFTDIPLVGEFTDIKVAEQFYDVPLAGSFYE